MALAVAKHTAASARRDAPLLAHLARGPEIEGPDHILNTVEQCQDLATISWAASAILCHLHEAPDNVSSSAVDTFGRCFLSIAVPRKAGHTKCSTAQLGNFSGNWRLHPPQDCPATHGSSLQVLDGLQREAASAVLGVLLELVRTRDEDLEFVREQILNEGEIGSAWLIALFSVMDEFQNSAKGDQKKPLPSGAARASADSGGAAFVNACHFLAVAAGGCDEVSKKMLNAHILDHVGVRLLRATVASSSRKLTVAAAHGTIADGDPMGTEWLPFATSAALLVDTLVASEDVDRHRLAEPALFRPMWVRGHKPDVVVDALLAALERNIIREGGSMVPQPLHLSGLRALGRIAHLSSNQAHRMIVANGLKLGVKALAIDAVDEEAVLVILWYLGEVASASPYAHKQLAALGTVEAVQRIVERYPRSQAVSFESARVLKACKGSHN